jgi:hypothetical protein
VSFFVGVAVQMSEMFSGEKRICFGSDLQVAHVSSHGDLEFPREYSIMERNDDCGLDMEMEWGLVQITFCFGAEVRK